MQPKRGKLSTPHFGPPTSYARIADQNPGYYSSPDNQRQACGHEVMNDKRKQGPPGEHERAIGRVSRGRVPKQQELALRHYSSLNHRSTERCPIWDSKNPSQCQSDQQHVRTRSGDILLKPGHPQSLTDVFSDRAPGGPIH
ncbi:hypothetical protein CDL15_Pgr002709 [Punica granatum]|uniref:Uncharacterized protein n=1 Tax=Punica granatum TaxID=22663 RepID=A0A218Y1N4_PUNGR|nr:hypothetical protein CDL15_Pgr002709 [Punica granatum]PKI52284.1 hypothetical protein CRG98_027326 [Punica granatum]